MMSSALLLQLSVFLALVLVHHFLLTPLLRKKKTWLYLAGIALLLGLFAGYCFAFSPRPEDMPLPPGEPGFPPFPQFDGPLDGRQGPPIRPQWMEFIIGILLIVADQGVMAWVRVRQNEKRMQALQTENLRQQLESLRYQINPHFFMNTLNNIQSLILTDPDKATEAIGEFSKLMRIVLYEGHEPTIPLSRELDYLQHYLSLMRLRYPKDIVIEADFPKECGNAVVPPLLMASFAENAFKHGISYTEESFVKLDVYTDSGRVTFHCLNTRHPGREDGGHGLGLDNIRKRLSLLYGSDFRLNIEEDAGFYDILLDIPQKPTDSAVSA